MKIDSKRAKSSLSTTARGRGTYTSQACNFCRMRKIKCNGTKPTCGSCDLSGQECSWGSEPVKRPSTKQYVQSLKTHIEALDAYVTFLESSLTRCQEEHGGFPNTHLYSRPVMSSFLPAASDMSLDEEGHGADIESATNSDQDADIEQLVAPTKHLVLQDCDLQLYGPTSIFRHEPKIPGRESRFPEISKSAERYVLMVDGTDGANVNFNFDWSRHLPAEVPLTRAEHDKALDLLFKFFTSWCLRIVPALFLRDMYRSLSASASEPPPKTTHYSPMLHNALIAVATAFSDNPRIRDYNSRQYFARKAKSYIETECQTPNISVVHALSIISSFHSSQGDQTLGYLYFGMSGRMSQALGLSIDCSPWVKANLITNEDMLDRNWAYWTTFTQDVCWSLYVGRDFAVPSPSDHSSLPVPFVDSEFDQIPWHYAPSGISPQPSFLSRTFAHTCELLKIARRIMDVVNGFGKLGVPDEVHQALVSKIDVQLNTWKDRLSPEVDITPSSRANALPHRLMLHLSQCWLFILIHRPFYRRIRPNPLSEKDGDHVKLCNRAAESIMELSTTWRTSYTLRFVPITMVQVLFSAGTVFLLSAVHATSGPRLAQQSLSHSMAQAELCVRYLSEIGQSWNCANHICDILGNLLQEQLKPRIGVEPQIRGRRSAPNTNGRTSPACRDSSKPNPVARHSMSSAEVEDAPWPASRNIFSNPDQLHSDPAGVMDFDIDIDRQLGVDQFLDGLRGGSNIGAAGFGGGFGFPGLGPAMLDGHTLSAHPFMPLGATTSASLEPGQFQQWSDSYHMSQQGPWSALAMPPEDMATLEQFWNQQQAMAV